MSYPGHFTLQLGTGQGYLDLVNAPYRRLVRKPKVLTLIDLLP